MDRLSNLIISIKNAGLARKDFVFVPFSAFNLALVRALFENGYISGYDRKNRSRGGDLIAVELKYTDVERRNPKIHDVKRLSKPSRRVYSGTAQMYQYRQGYGHVFISTPKGVLTSTQARDAHVGGEVLFAIW